MSDTWKRLSLAACGVLILTAVPAQYFGRQHDDLLYFIAAQAMSDGGYGLLVTPGTPPLVMLTPGFPLLLLPLALLFGEWVPAYQIFCAVVMAAVPWLLWVCLKRTLDSGQAFLIALIFGTHPLVLSQAGTVMTEGTYTLLSALLLMALAGHKPGRTGLLLLVLTQVRPAGLSVVPAAVARSVRARRWKEAGWILAPAVIGVLAWCLWSYSVHGGVQEVEEIALAYQGQPTGHPLAVAWDNARIYLSTWGSCHLPAGRGQGPLAFVLGALLGGLMLAGLVRRLRADPTDPDALLLAGGVCLHAFWTWQYERYLIPLLPWMLWATAQAMSPSKAQAKPAPVPSVLKRRHAVVPSPERAAGRGRQTSTARAPVPLLRNPAGILLTVLLLTQVVFHVPRLLKADSWKRPELAETYRRIRSDPGIPPGLISSALHVRDAYYTARPGVALPDMADPRGLADLLRKQQVSIVLWQEGIDIGLSLDKTANLRRRLDRAGKSLLDPRCFRVIYENHDERSRIHVLR